MFRMMRLRLQIQFWRSLGQLAIWLRDTGQRCYAWYEQHSPMKIVMDGKPAAASCIYPRETCPLAHLWSPEDEGVWDRIGAPVAAELDVSILVTNAPLLPEFV